MTYLRKTPRQARSQATFEAIVEAAARILAETGPRGLRTSHVAERAGVSVGSLYQYFPDRKAIVRALIERQLARAEATRPAALDDAARGRGERLRAAVDWQLDLHAADPALSRALHALAEETLPPEELRAFAELRRGRTARFVRSVGLPQDVDPDTVAFVVETCLAALCEAATARLPEALSSERFRDEVTTLLDRYLSR
ncbi:MAG: TetR/AcrR family transcriptional regulator [Thermodesulfobacteriota bacterium]